MDTKGLKVNEGLHPGCEVRVLAASWDTEEIYTTGVLRRWDGPDCIVSDVQVWAVEGKLLTTYPDQRYPAARLAKIRDANGMTATSAENSRIMSTEIIERRQGKSDDIGGLRYAAKIVDDQAAYTAQLALREQGKGFLHEVDLTAAVGKPEDAEFPAHNMADVNRIFRRHQKLVTELLARVTALETALRSMNDNEPDAKEDPAVLVAQLGDFVAAEKAWEGLGRVNAVLDADVRVVAPSGTEWYVPHHQITAIYRKVL